MISELTRVKILFQARAIAVALGAPQPTSLPAPARKALGGGDEQQ
jgi:hypothetical protein